MLLLLVNSLCMMPKLSLTYVIFVFIKSVDFALPHGC